MKSAYLNTTGQGMLIKDGEEHWTITWRGALCGLGAGDLPWRDRYGQAWGARVQFPAPVGRPLRGVDAYVNTRSGYIHDYNRDANLEPADGT